MKSFKRGLSFILVIIMMLSALPSNIIMNADEMEVDSGEKAIDTELAAAEKVEEEIINTEIAEIPSTVTERGMQFKIENLESVKSIRYAYGEHETEKDIKYGEGAVSHSAKLLRKRGNGCTLQFTKPGLVSIVVTYNDGTRDFYKYEVIKSSPTVTRDGGNNITFGNLNDLKVLRYVKGEYETSYDIKRATGSVAISGKTLTSDTYTVALERETYTFCVQYNDESYNYYVTGICGDNLTWVYDMQSATLTVSGEGEMYDYNYYNYETIPWWSYRSIIKTVILESGITKIGDYSFSEHTSLIEVEFAPTLETIGLRAFYECTLLNSIDLPFNLAEIDGLAFKNCTSLEAVVIPDSVTYLDIEVFNGCTDLESATIGNGVETIPVSAFYGCHNLKNVTFGSNVKYIESYAFYHCTSLNDIDFPDSLEGIIDLAPFYDTGYYNNRDNWENNVLYIDGHMISTGENDIGTCIIKDGTKSIASCAFESSYVDIVYIPESVRFIGSGGLSTYNYGHKRDYTHFMVVKGSYAEQYIIEQYETIGNKYSYGYFNPSDVYG